MKKIPDSYRKLKQTKEEIVNLPIPSQNNNFKVQNNIFKLNAIKETKQNIEEVTSFKTLKDKRDPLNAGYALRNENKYRRAVRFDGGSP